VQMATTVLECGRRAVEGDDWRYVPWLKVPGVRAAQRVVLIPWIFSASSWGLLPRR
jgi:hypothetical protein